MGAVVCIASVYSLYCPYKLPAVADGNDQRRLAQRQRSGRGRLYLRCGVTSDLDLYDSLNNVIGTNRIRNTPAQSLNERIAASRINDTSPRSFEAALVRQLLRWTLSSHVYVQ